MRETAPTPIEFMPFAADSRIYRCAPLEIPGLSGARPLSLWLPPDYSDSRRWPLALFFDGQNLFDDAGTLAGGWQLHRILDSRAAQGLTVPVVVGLHAGPERESELSPWPPFEQAQGLGGRQLEWIVSDLLPQLRSGLHVSADPLSTLLGGSSLGGLLALYGLFHHPETFGQALVMSPALWPDRFAIFQDLMLHQPHADARIYLDHGQREVLEAGKQHLGQILFEQSQLLADLLDVLGFGTQRLRWLADPEGEHREACWSRRLPGALNFLYGEEASGP